jgi:hypothetical protein
MRLTAPGLLAACIRSTPAIRATQPGAGAPGGDLVPTPTQAPRRRPGLRRSNQDADVQHLRPERTAESGPPT